MILKKWEDLPEDIKKDAVKPYYAVLKKKKAELIVKRAFDIVASSVMIVIFSPLLAGVAIGIKKHDNGPVFYRQLRITQYGREFKIIKFRTMVENADKFGAQVTGHNDSRITPIGVFLREYRLDEVPQLFNILLGEMSFVGTRPEVPKYVVEYSDEMMATLLLPAGVTSEASVAFKDEAELLKGEMNIDDAYIRKVLPKKMEYNLKQLNDFSLLKELILIFRTVIAVIK